MVVHVAAVVSSAVVVVAVDVGKSSFAVSVTDGSRRRLFGPVDAPMTAPGVRDVVARVSGVLPDDPVVVVKVGVEAAGHYHWPLLTATAWPQHWEVLELTRRT